jgi:hypothetical protein
LQADKKEKERTALLFLDAWERAVLRSWDKQQRSESKVEIIAYM